MAQWLGLRCRQQQPTTTKMKYLVMPKKYVCCNECVCVRACVWVSAHLLYFSPWHLSGWCWLSTKWIFHESKPRRVKREKHANKVDNERARHRRMLMAQRLCRRQKKKEEERTQKKIVKSIKNNEMPKLTFTKFKMTHANVIWALRRAHARAICECRRQTKVWTDDIKSKLSVGKSYFNF